jgi:hypothetical protein
MVQLWVLGVVLGTTGSIGNNLGNNLVSLGHKERHDEEDKKKLEGEDAVCCMLY